ncbi:hypothetical protein KEF85_00065 [Methylomonas paludis]|uniref:Sugar transferase n=1 Tax=Methylomonas paludis TaxID=1173101 RepID=A0A975RA58_9GAMM|nr:hypothetical protein [Methylomonas paludis]QWF70939.1 hypothetical protein KEF85_00065 [Methylomonas paludis]
MSKLAPIVLFVFARPHHTKNTLNALAANELAMQSDLIIYADGANNPVDQERVDEVRNIIRNTGGFRSITLIERDTNFGLARNIITGVTEVCNQYQRVIVLEDDIVTSPCFLTYMNHALDEYANKKSVWHIAGWSYPVNIENTDGTFFWRLMNCWGWATWSDRWQYFEKNPAKLLLKWNKDKIKRFNLDGVYDFWKEVDLNQSEKLNTWAIFWYATIFEHNGLCLSPTHSFVQNIGNDGSGINSQENNIFWHNNLAVSYNRLPSNIEESQLAVQEIKAFYTQLTPPFPIRLRRYALRKINKLIKYLIGG